MPCKFFFAPVPCPVLCPVLCANSKFFFTGPGPAGRRLGTGLGTGLTIGWATGGVSSPAAFPSWFTKRLLNRRVRVRCYARDQYGRIVGTVQYGIRRRDLSTELLRKGLASVYRSAGAVYAQRPLSGWDAIEARAQRNRLGMWQRGVSAAMLPGEFKARQRKRKAKS